MSSYYLTSPISNMIKRLKIFPEKPHFRKKSMHTTSPHLWLNDCDRPEGFEKG